MYKISCQINKHNQHPILYEDLLRPLFKQELQIQSLQLQPHSVSKMDNLQTQSAFDWHILVEFCLLLTFQNNMPKDSVPDTQYRLDTHKHYNQPRRISWLMLSEAAKKLSRIRKVAHTPPHSPIIKIIYFLQSCIQLWPKHLLNCLCQKRRVVSNYPEYSD